MSSYTVFKAFERFFRSTMDWLYEIPQRSASKMKFCLIVLMVLILAFPALNIRSAYASQGWSDSGYFNLTTTNEAPKKDCNLLITNCNCGNVDTCHAEYSATDDMWSFTNGSGALLGDQIYFNMTVYAHKLESVVQDDSLACMIMNDSTAPAYAPYSEGWTIVKTEAIGETPTTATWTQGYNLVVPWTSKDGITANYTCEWTLTRPPDRTDPYVLMGMFRYAAGGASRVKLNSSKSYDYSGPVPEFPLGLAIPFTLSLLAYAHLRRQLIEERV